MSTELAIESPDGVRHTAQVFRASRNDAPVVLCLPAMGAGADYYQPFGEGVARMGAGTAALLDLRGQGRSSAFARRGDDFGYREILELDLPAAVAALRGLFPGRALYLAGHSLGGQLGLLYAARNPSMLEGLVLIAAGTAHYRAWPRGSRASAWLYLSAIRVAAALLPWYPGTRLGFGGDQPRRLMRDWGRVVQHGLYQPEGSQFDYERALRTLCVPILSLSVQGDPVAPLEAREQLLAKAPSAPVTRIEVTGVLAHRPWKRHFSWAREPAELVGELGAWIRYRSQVFSPSSTGKRAACGVTRA
ncbi:MAG TPA: alpha/beta fold hydrolase [Burkholderiales bacterium]